MAVEGEQSSSASSTSATTTVTTTDALTDGNEGDYYQVRPIDIWGVRLDFLLSGCLVKAGRAGRGACVLGRERDTREACFRWTDGSKCGVFFARYSKVKTFYVQYAEPPRDVWFTAVRFPLTSTTSA